MSLIQTNDAVFERGDLIRWTITLCIAAIDAVWLSASRFSVHGTGSLRLYLIPIIIWASLALLASIPRYREVSSRFFTSRVKISLHCFLLPFVFAKAAAILQYLGIALNFPVIDDSLYALDHMLGFEWKTAFLWVRAHTLISEIFNIAYYSFWLQLLALPWLLGLSGRFYHLREWLSAMMLSCLLVVAISTPFPAHSAFTYFHAGNAENLDTVSHFQMLRDGTMQTLDIRTLQGLVSMPSFHAVLAVLLSWALRFFRPLFVAVSLWNLIMLLATPTEGGHYLSDVIAGLMVAIFTLYAVTWSARRRAKNSPLVPFQRTKTYVFLKH
ncbi:MAG: phosphatase PAP2 family protein [Burkholderiales bacterium]|nr:phosphatase PAP2 family protein [Burkholderiales bacterium]